MEVPSRSWSAIAKSPSAQIGVGLAVGQGAIFGLTPFLTRLYPPDVMGFAGVFLAIASIAGAVGTLRMELMVPSASDEHTAWMMRFSTLALVLVAIIVSAATSVVMKLDPFTMCLLMLTIFGIGTVALTLQVSARRETLRTVAAAKAAQGVGQAGAQVGLGLGGAIVHGMPGGYAAGYLLASAIQLAGIMRARQPATFTRTISVGKAARSARRRIMWRALVLTLAALINSLAVWFLLLVTQGFFGADAAGQLTVAQRLAVAPVGLLVAALVPVLAAQVGALVRKGEDVRPLVRLWLRRLVPLGMAFGAVLLLVPDRWITAALGAEWAHVAPYFSALAVGLVAQIAVGPLGQLLAMQGRSMLQLKWDAARLLTLILVCGLVVARGGSALGTVFAGSVVLAFYYLIYLILVLRPGSRTVRRASASAD